MARPSKYPRELKGRAVRMEFESKNDYPSEFEAIRTIASKLGSARPRRYESGCGERRSMVGAGRERPAPRSLRSGI